MMMYTTIPAGCDRRVHAMLDEIARSESPWLEPDEMVDALVAAVAELTTARRSEVFDAAKHPRNPKGAPGGGRFRSIADRVMDALSDWLKGDGPDRPLTTGDHRYTQAQLKSAAERMGITVPPRSKAQAIEDLILGHVRDQHVAGKVENPGPRKEDVTFSLRGPGRKNVTAVVYQNSKGELILRPENVPGHPARDAITTQPDLASLEKWANDNGEPGLAKWARGEIDKTAPKTPAKKAAPTLRPGAMVPAGEPIPEDLSGHAVVPKTRVQGGDIAVWEAPGESPIHGRVVDEGPRRKFVDWQGGRREPLNSAKSPNVTFYRAPDAAAPSKASPAKAAEAVEPGAGSGAPADFDARAKRAKSGEAAMQAASVRLDETQRTPKVHGLEDLPPERQQFIADQLALFGARGSLPVNMRLRGQSEGTLHMSKQEINDLQAGLDEAFDHASLSHDAVAWRGFSGYEAFGPDPDKWPADLTGTSWSEPGYSSVSAQRRVAETFRRHQQGVLARIILPEGSPAIELTPHHSEAELLLSRGWTFRVVRDHGSVKATNENIGGQVRLLDVEAIPPPRTAGGAGPKGEAAKAVEQATKADPLASLPPGLTTVQKRAALRKRGLSKAEIDALVPPEKKPAAKAAAAKASSAKPLTGDKALAAPTHNLEALTAAGDPRADSLWYLSGDNSTETGSGLPGSFELARELRGLRTRTPENRKRIKDIDSIMRESQLSEPIEVYRGIGGSRLREPGRRVGTEFTDKAFAATSTDPHHAAEFGGTVMRIRVPVGVSAIRMADRPGSRYEHESEILLDRGLRYRIVAEYPRGRIPGFGGQHVVDVEIVR